MEILQQFLKILSDGLTGSIIGITGILIAIATIFIARKRKLVVYYYKKTRVMKNFENQIDGLEINYNGQPISNLTSTRIAIWNNGREVVRRDDVARKDPITIHFREMIIGEPTISFALSDSSEIELAYHQNKITLYFDHLEFGEGAVIQVFHTLDSTGEMAQDNPPINKQFYITGKIIGAKKIEWKHQTRRSLLDAIPALGVLAVLILIYLLSLLEIELVNPDDESRMLLMMIVGYVLTLAFSFRRVFSKKIAEISGNSCTNVVDML